MAMSSRKKIFKLILAAWALAAGAAVMAQDNSAQQRRDLLDLHNGAVILSHTGSEYGKEYPVSALIDGTLVDYWASSETALERKAQHSFIIELDRVYAIDQLVVDNRENDEMDYPGVSARQVLFFASTESPTGDWEPMADMEAKKFGRKEMFLDKPVTARWVKVEVHSNYGHRLYTEISELEAYGEPLGERPGGLDPNGVYQTNYGYLMFHVEGDRVEGCYELDKGYVFGSTDGRVFDIEWVEHKGKERGAALMVLSSTGFLNGMWYEEGQMKGPWFGNKLPAEETIDCDPVTAAIGVGLNSGAIADR